MHQPVTSLATIVLLRKRDLDWEKVLFAQCGMKLASCSFLFIEMMQPTKSLAPSSSTTVATLLMYATLIFHLHLAHCSSPFSSKPKFGPHKLGKCSLAFSYSQRNSGARLSAKLSSIRRNIATATATFSSYIIVSQGWFFASCQFGFVLNGCWRGTTPLCTARFRAVPCHDPSIKMFFSQEHYIDG